MSNPRVELALEKIQIAKEKLADNLDLSGLSLGILPDELGYLSNLKRLDISSNQLKEIPIFIYNLQRLEQLDIGNNRVVELQPDIQQLTELVSLDISENRLSCFPSHIDKLIHLRALRLYSNRLIELPDTLCMLNALEELDVANNKLSFLPSLIGLSSLKCLDVSFNQLRNIPDSLSYLSKLRRLDLSNNELKTIGSNLVALGNLEELYLDNNNLTDLPTELEHLSNLWGLSVDGNPLQHKPAYLEKVNSSVRRQQASEKIKSYIWSDSQSDNYHFIEPEIIFGFFLAISSIQGIISAIDLYYKHFQKNCSVKLIYPSGTEVNLQQLSRKKAIKIAQEHEKRLGTKDILIDLETAREGSFVEAKRSFAVETIARIPYIKLLPKQSNALPIQFQNTKPNSIRYNLGETNMLPILFLAADPSDATRIRLGDEAREIQEKLQLSKMRDLFVFEQRWSVRPEDLTQALIDINPQVVHFSGHGTSTGAICLLDKLGKTHPIEPADLAALFELVADRVQCVVLNACYSKIQADAIANYIPFVIGMNQEIGDKAAIAFSVGFYQALGGGHSIEDAYKFGCVQIRLQNIPEHLVPDLVKKSDIPHMST